MNEDDGRRIAALLEEIRDGQREQLARQAEALALQREQVALVQRQFERADKLQDRAETIQARSGDMVRSAHRAVAIILPIVVLLLVYASWLLFRR
jgi:hypothetical protein